MKKVPFYYYKRKFTYFVNINDGTFCKYNYLKIEFDKKLIQYILWFFINEAVVTIILISILSLADLSFLIFDF